MLDNVVTVGGAVEAAARVEAAADPPPAYEDVVPDNYALVQEILNETGPVQVLLILLLITL